jgi:hypothetical protein
VGASTPRQVAPPCRFAKPPAQQVNNTAYGGRGGGQLKVQLMIQRIPDARSRMCTVLWDTGAQISLRTHQYAREAGFKGRPASIQISGVGVGSKNR